jgi:heptosyltransferase-2
MPPSLLKLSPPKILIRSTNWIGDAIMTTPAIRTIRENFPKSEISVLVNPWVADVFAASPFVDNIILYHKADRHKGLVGMWRLGRELSNYGFDLAILLQNAFEAAFIGKIAGVPAIAGYKRDCRGPLLLSRVSGGFGS